MSKPLTWAPGETVVDPVKCRRRLEVQLSAGYRPESYSYRNAAERLEKLNQLEKQK